MMQTCCCEGAAPAGWNALCNLSSCVWSSDPNFFGKYPSFIVVPNTLLILFLKQVAFLSGSSSLRHVYHITSSCRPRCPSLRVRRRESSRHTLEHNALLRSRRSLARGNRPSRQHRHCRHSARINRRPPPRWRF